MIFPLLLSVYYRYRYYRTIATPVPGIATSGHQEVLLHRYGLLRFGGGSQGSPVVGFVGWDPSWNQQS